MIETAALTSLENLYRLWHEDASTFLDGVVTRSKCKLAIDDDSIPCMEKWEEFPDQLYYPDTDDSYIEKEIKDNLLIFNRDGLEFNYLQRIDSLYGNIESAKNRYITEFNHVSKRVRLGENGENCRHELTHALSEFMQIQFVLIKGVRGSFYVSEHPEKFPFLGPFVKMYHQSKTEFAKDPNKAGVLYKQNERKEWVMVGNEPEPVEPDRGLSALQKLLFVRLLQRANLFPKKPANTDDAPELRAIALLTGLDFNNDIKGGKGADAKVNQLLNNRKSLTVLQIPHKIADLNAVENVAKLLNVEPVVSAIQVIRAELEKIRDS